MKKLLYTAIAVAIFPLTLTAQVEKRVEVTKAYVPSVENAAKLAIVPDMTDTVRMRPDIDYTVTPLSLQTTLATRPIRPATVTYWEFNRPKNFYIKAGAGFPLNSVFDFYAASQNPGTGYVVGYVNHEGRYAKIENDFGIKNNSTRMLNRIGAAAGKYFGKRTLEGEIAYENRLYHRYAELAPQPNSSTYMPGSRVDFGDATAAFRFGDDFYDLSRVNFEVGVSGSFFSSYPEVYDYTGSDWQEVKHRPRQTTLGADARIAKAFGRHRFAINLGYKYMDGNEDYRNVDQQQMRIGLRYGIDGGLIRAEAGLDYYHDAVRGAESGNYVIPYARLKFDIGKESFCPFLEVDGGVYDNSPRSISRSNPYAMDGIWADSSVDYGGRLGAGGNLWNNKFDYRIYAGVVLHDNRLYWYTAGEHYSIAEMGRQTEMSMNAEAAWRPVGNFRMGLAVRGYIYNDETENDGPTLHSGCPAFRGELTARYDHRKITFGAGIYMQSDRKWSVRTWDGVNFDWGTYEAPFACDLRVDFGWKVTQMVTVFAEGRNLANSALYEYPWYKGYGINFTAGVKMNF